MSTIYNLVICLSIIGNCQAKIKFMVYDQPPIIFPMNDRVKLNTDLYVQQFNEALDQYLLVFPKLGLVGTAQIQETDYVEIPDSALQQVTCDHSNYHYVLQRISCTSRQKRIAAVLNVPEKHYTTKNGQEYTAHYHTTIVFNFNGTLIARHRQMYSLGEQGIDSYLEPQNVTFNLNGERFGIVDDSDLLFRNHALDVAYRASRIVYPTAWKSELPFLTTLQIQSGFATNERLSLVASSLNFVQDGYGGSGIYDVRTREAGLEVSMLVPGRNLLPGPLEGFKSIVIDRNTRRTLCDGKFCCSIDVRMEKADTWRMYRSYIYQFLVFSGRRSFYSNEQLGVEVCSLVRCVNQSVQSCNRVNDTLTQGFIFNEIKISGKLTSTNSSIFPTTLFGRYGDENTFNTLTPGGQYEFVQNNSHFLIHMNRFKNNLITFGVYNRMFSSDILPSSATNFNHFIILYFTLFLNLLLPFI